MRALAELKQQQLQRLKVKAGVAGVLVELPLQVGQHVLPGTELAKIVQPNHLMAELKIPETQARDVQIGEPASIDTHNGVIAGEVSRVDPAVQNGTVTVDVKLTGELPKGARPDLSVDGTIDLEKLGERALRRTSRVRTGEQHDLDVQARPGWQRRISRTR